jgi:peptide/nickel transport system permease protein
MTSVSVAEIAAPTRPARVRSYLRRFPLSARIAAFLLFAFVVIAITGPLWAPYGYAQTAVGLPFSGSSSQHWFGTDILGRDVFSRVVYGTRDVLYLSLTSTAVSVVLGGLIGLASGLVGGWIDEVLMRLFETIISIPLLVLALLAIAAAGPQLSGNALLLMGVVVLVYAPRIARMARAVAIDLVTRDFVTIARTRGESVRSIVWRELTPNAAGVLLVEFGVRAGYAPILISSLGFLGFGERPPSPEWGLMISENRAALATAPLTVLAPAGALAILVISLNLVTDGIARVIGRTAERTP